MSCFTPERQSRLDAPLRAKRHQQAKFLLWDEAPMTNRHCYEAADRTLRDILDKDEPFGGMVVNIPRRLPTGSTSSAWGRPCGGGPASSP